MQLCDIVKLCSAFMIPDTPQAFRINHSGNINKTYFVDCADGKSYLLQQINTNVFADPDALMQNILGITYFLRGKIQEAGGDPLRETLTIIPTKEGTLYARDEQGECWRMYHCITNATAYDAPEREGLLFEAAKAFGIFQNQLADYPAEQLSETIPFFHDTRKRYTAFQKACEQDLAKRASSVSDEITVLNAFADRAGILADAIEDGRLPVRVTHNDTKLNNVMIDNKTGRGICVIDLDTVMPGSLLYDFGDSIRYAANNTAEDDPDPSRVFLRLDLYEEYLRGFLEGVGDSITSYELELLPMSAFVLTYELALRFMTDYLNGDTYFKTLYPEHNLVRTRNQICLMQDIDANLAQMDVLRKKYRA